MRSYYLESRSRDGPTTFLTFVLQSISQEAFTSVFIISTLPWRDATWSAVKSMESRTSRLQPRATSDVTAVMSCDIMAAWSAE